MWQIVFETGQAEACEEVPDGFAAVPLLPFENLHGKERIFFKRKPWKEQVFLLHIGGDMLEVVYASTTPRYLSGIHGKHPHEHVKKRAFAAARRADEGAESAARNLQIQILKDR